MITRRTARSLARSVPLLVGWVAVLGLLVAVAGAGAAPARAVPPLPVQDHEPGVQLLLDDIRPAIASPGTPLVFTGTLTNPGPEAVRVDAVRVSTAYRGLDTREGVQAWEMSGESDTPVEVGTDTIDAVVAPGATVTWFVHAPGDTLTPDFDFATLPLAVEVIGALPEESGDGAPQEAVDEEDTGPTQQLAAQRTFLPWQAAPSESFNPIDIAWVAPVTLPGGAALVSANETERTRAWAEAIGSRSGNVALLEGLAGTEATFLVDPAVLDPLDPVGSLIEEHLAQQDPADPPTEDPSLPEPTEQPTAQPSGPTSEPPPPAATEAPGGSTAPGPTGSPGNGVGDPTGAAPGSGTDATGGDPGRDDGTTGAPGGAADDAADTAGPDADEPDLPGEADLDQEVGALRELLEQVPQDQLWWLPVGDTDVSALLHIDAGTDQIAELVSRPGVPELPPGRTDASWPAPTALSDDAVETLRQVWARAGGPTGADEPGGGDLATVLVPTSDSTPGPFTEQAAVPHTSGTVLLGYDERLSGIVGGAGARDRDAATVQRFLAETLATYQEFPANDRSLVVAVPRGAELEADTLRSLTEGTEAADWLAPTSARDLVAGAAAREPVAVTGAERVEPAEDDPAVVSQVGGSPLTPHRISGLEDARERLHGAAQMVPDTDAAAAVWDRALDRQYSTRWRLDDQDWASPVDRATRTAEEVLSGVRINPTTINFLADEGLIQITVTNELPVPVEDLQMAVSPGNARLRVLGQPDPFTIGAESRATVQFRAKAVASGQAPLNTMLSTENGTRVGAVEKMQVRVQPTGIWIYWLLGGVAGVILVLGLVRALRPRSRQDPDESTPDTTVSEPEST